MADGYSGNGSRSLAERMSDVMSGTGDGPIRAAAKAAAEQGGEPRMFSMVQRQPFKAAEVEDPAGTGTVTVLYPAPMPRPPNTVSTRFVGPEEAMQIIATTPFEPIEFASESFPDLALVPTDVGENIKPD